MVFHALAKNALFLCAGAVICKTGCVRIKEMKGMGRRMPAVMICFALASLSLVGIPPAGGFLAKWHLAVGAMRTEAGLFTWLGPVVLIVSALLTAGYLFPVIVEGFFRERTGRKRKIRGRQVLCGRLGCICVYKGAPGSAGYLPAGAGRSGKSCI